MGFKSGFVAIGGRPNVGKSTLLNHILGQKISIVSDKPQTTRKRVKGILNRVDAQIVFVDTPGLHVPKDELGKFMVQEIEDSLIDADLLCYLTDPFQDNRDRGASQSLLRAFSRPIFLVINKKDLVSQEGIEAVIRGWRESLPFRETMAVSALTGEGVPELIETILRYLPENPAYYEEGFVSDTFERDIVAEIIREKVWWHTYEEVPYGIEVRVEEFKEKENVLYLRALIYVERESHKKIIIGEKGQNLKKIGQSAREEIEAQWGKKVFLDLWVKVEKNWRKRKEVLWRWGYRAR